MHYIVLLLSIIFLTACQYNNGEFAATTTPIDMDYNTTYTLNHGDTLVKTSDDAVVTITQMTQADNTQVVLVQGHAQIILGN